MKMDVKTEVDTTLSDLDLKTKDPIAMIAAIFSWVAAPLLIPLYGMTLVFSLSIMKYASIESQLLVLGVVFCTNAVLPVMLFCLLKLLGVIKDVALNEQKERAIPYVIMILCYLASAYFLYTRQAPMWVVMFSSTTMASSTTEPIAIERHDNEIMLIEPPSTIPK